THLPRRIGTSGKSSLHDAIDTADISSSISEVARTGCGTGRTQNGGGRSRCRDTNRSPVCRAETHCSNGEMTMRWKKWVGGLALLLATAAGCKQQVFMTAPDFQENKALALQ